MLPTDQRATPPPISAIGEATPEEVAEFFAISQALAERGLTPERVGALEGPTTDDELWDQIYELTGYAIPRVAVCAEHGHVAPFTIFADVYFCRRFDVLMIGNRGGGKTTISGFLHGAKCRWLKGYRSTIVGACLPRGTMIKTRNGSVAIDKIVRERLPIEVRTFNFERRQWEWRRVVDWHFKGYTKDWVRIKDDLGQKITTTPNHWMPLSDGSEKQAEHLRTGDELCVETWCPSEEQEQILLGLMLGDGSVNRKRNLCVVHADRQRRALDWYEDAFRELRVNRRAVGQRTYLRWGVQSRFYELHRDWYARPQQSRYSEGLWHGKQIPKGALEHLTSLGLAVWLMSDGCYTQRKNDNLPRWFICTQALDEGSRAEIANYFERMGIRFAWRRVEGGWNIHFTQAESQKITSLVAPYLDVREKQERGWKRWIAKPISRHGQMGFRAGRVVVVEKQQTRQPVQRFDLTVDGNANYMTAAGILVHNTELQAGRGYTEFKRFSRQIQSEIIRSLMKKTEFVNASEVEVLTGTLKQVNGPHPHFAQFDELELSTQVIFEEFQNMSQGDSAYPSQNLLSSTRKFVFGLIQQIVKAAEADIAEGSTPEWDVMIFCVFETMAKVPNCRRAPDNERQRIKEEKLEARETGFESRLCDCHLWKKGEWEDGTPRTFDTVCRGRAARSDGFQQLIDVLRRFKRLSQEVWEAQQECLRPDPQGLVHKWLRLRHIVPIWYPEPEYGSIYRSWDWGGENAHSVHFSQLLDVPVEIEHEGQVYQFNEGDLITFDEVYYRGGSYADLGIRVARRAAQWRSFGYEFEVMKDICDPAGKTPKRDVAQAMRRNGFPEPDWASKSAPRIDSVKKHIEWGRDGRLKIVGSMCPWLLEEYAVYHYPPVTDSRVKRNESEDPVKVFDHAMDDQRYIIWYLYKGDPNAETDVPTSAPRHRERLDKQSGMRNALGHQHRPNSPVESSQRRYQAGSPVTSSVRTADYPMMPGEDSWLRD